jgi:hypothetical protein
VFVGRADEHARLLAALDRGRLSFVWGLGGIGKSSLVCSALRAAGARRTVVVDVRAGEEIASILASATGAIASAIGIPTSPLAGDLESVVSAALRVADDDACPWTIVLDNLHRARGDVAAALGLLDDYARSSRWLAISRAAPPDTVDPAQVVALGALTTEATTELARAIAPEASDHEIRLATDRAAGSPWRLRQLVAGRKPTTEPGADPILESLDDATRTFLRALAAIEISIPLALVPAFTALPPAGVVETLEHRGLLERGPAGVRVHDVTRSLLRSTQITADRATRDRIAHALTAEDDIHLVAEGIRIAIEDGDFRRARAALDRRAGELLAPEMLLFTEQLLREVDAPELYDWCLRAAIERGDASAVARLGPPPDSADPAVLLLWARAERLRGDLDQARASAAAAAAAADASDRADVCEAARELEVRCAMACGDYRAAQQLLDTLERSGSANQLMVDMYQARCAVELDDVAAARRFTERLRQRAAALHGDALRESGFELATALHHCGDLIGAETLIERVAAQLGEQRLASYQDRLSMEVTAYLATERGRLEAARRALEALSQQPAIAPFARLFHHHIDAARRLYAGELGGLETLCEQLLSESAGRDDAMTSALNLGWRLAALRGRADVTALVDLLSELGDRPRSRMPRLCREEYDARRGGPVSLALELLGAHAPTVRCQALVVAALAAAPDDPERASELARQAADAAHVAGFGALEATALSVLCDAALAAGAVPAAAAAADRLLALARAMPSARFTAEARLYVALCSPAVLDPGLLETLAAAPDTAPIACRRARALLGGSASLDRIDQLVVDAAVARAAPWRVVGSGKGGWGHGLLIDDRSRSVWLPERGGAVELHKTPLLWRLLIELADHSATAGGAVGKEQLVRVVWEVAEYHPLRHDNKLHAAIKNLRKRIELDPAHPTRILTTEDGYRLSVASAVRRITTSAHTRG